MFSMKPYKMLLIIFTLCATMARQQELEADHLGSAENSTADHEHHLSGSTNDSACVHMTAYTGKPIIVRTSGDQVLSIYRHNEKVVLTCQGEGITGGYWERVDGSSLPNANNKSSIRNSATVKMIINKARHSHSGMYRCVLYNQCGVTMSEVIKVSIEVAPPVFVIQPNSLTVVALRDATITCKAKGFRVEYEWHRHHGSINSQIRYRSSLTISKAIPSDEDQYYCVAMTAGGYVFSNNASLTVRQHIHVTSKPKGGVLLATNDNITLQVMANGPRKQDFQYCWKEVDGPLPVTSSGQGTAKLTILSTLPSDSGLYYCVVTNLWGNVVESDRIAINVLDVTLHSENQLAAEGETIVLKCDIHGGDVDDLMYQWIRFGQEVTTPQAVVNGTNPLAISNISVNESGEYQCAVFSTINTDSSIKSNLIDITVLDLPIITTHPNSNGSITVAEGSDVVLRCEAIGNGTLNFQWKNGMSGSPLPQESLDNTINGTSQLTIHKITVVDSGQYYCEVDNGGTSVPSMMVQVTVKSKPTITSVSGDQHLSIVSNSQQVVLTCKATGENITNIYWEKLNGSLPDKNNHSLFDKDERLAQLNITKAHPHHSGDYQCVTHSIWGTTQSRIISVTIVAAPPAITRQPTNKTVHVRGNVTFTCEAEGFHVIFEWRHYNSNNYVVVGNQSSLTVVNANPLSEGRYLCVAMTGKRHQVYSDTAFLSINVSLAWYEEYTAAVVTINQSWTFTVTVEGPESYELTYHWCKTNHLPCTVSGWNTSNFTITSVSPSDDGTYYCNVTDQWGNTIAVKRVELHVLYIKSHLQNNSAAVGSPVNFTCESSLLSSEQYRWLHNGTLLSNETSAILNIGSMRLNDTGVYQCIVMANNVSVKANVGQLFAAESSALEPQPTANRSKSYSKTVLTASVITSVVILIAVVGMFTHYKYNRKNRQLQADAAESATVMEPLAAGPVEACVQHQTEQATNSTVMKQITVSSTENIMDDIESLSSELQDHIIIDELLPYLIEYKILTKHEKQQLSPEFRETNCWKVQKLLSLLHSKDLEGQQNFIKAIYKSSKKEGNSGPDKIVRLFQDKGIIVIKEVEATSS